MQELVSVSDGQYAKAETSRNANHSNRQTASQKNPDDLLGTAAERLENANFPRLLYDKSDE